MTRLRWFVVVLLLATGCGTDRVRDDDIVDHLHGVEVQLPDGRPVTCVVYEWGNTGGVTCDWPTSTPTPQ